MSEDQLRFSDFDSKDFLTFYKSTELRDSGTTTTATVLVRFFLRDDVYFVFEDAARMIAKEFYQSASVLNTLENTALQYVGLRMGMFLEVLRDLLVDRARSNVQVYEYTGHSEWQLVQQGSPSRLQDFEEILFGVDQLLQVSVVGSIWVEPLPASEGNLVGFSFTDLSGEKILQTCEFSDDATFSNLENAILQVGAREIVAPEIPAIQNPKLHQVFEKCNTMLVLRPRQLFAKEIESTLQNLLKVKNIQEHSYILNLHASRKSLCGLINFTELMMQQTLLGTYQLTNYNPKLYLRLDSAALTALHIFPQMSNKQSNNHCLYGFMSKKCCTQMGKRLLLTWMRQPSVDYQTIVQRQDVVECFVENSESRNSLRSEYLKFLPDLSRLAGKLQTEKASLKDLYALYVASMRIPAIAAIMPQELAATFSEPLQQLLGEKYLGKFQRLVESALDSEHVQKGEYLISSDYSSELKEVGRNRDKLEQEVDNLAREASEYLGLTLESKLRLDWHKLANTRKRCLRITKKDEQAVRNKLTKRYIDLGSNNDGHRFTSKALQEVADLLFEATADYEDKQKDLVQEVIKVAASFGDVWRQVCSIIGRIDVLCTFAEVALTCGCQPYVRPKIVDSLIEGGNEIKLLASRHPLLELQDEVDFVQNDCWMKNGESWFLVVTGPNMGGKSTYIRQVGLCFVLGQMGSYVPCKEAVIPIRDAVFTRLGAHDCSSRAVSTFMQEMLDTSTIVKNASSQSLVIVDELGRGTSTTDGFGIAKAVSEHILQNIHCPTLFATHFHTLLPPKGGVKNVHVHCVVEPGTGKPNMLYEVQDGGCDSSFGINVAKLVGFPERVTDNAQHTLKALESGKNLNPYPQHHQPLENIDCNAQKNDPLDNGQKRCFLTHTSVDVLNRVQEVVAEIRQANLIQCEQEREKQLRKIKDEFLEESQRNCNLKQYLRQIKLLAD